MTEDWRHRYNYHRPLGGLPPIQFAMAKSLSTSASE